MGISRTDKERFDQFSEDQIERIIRMGWEDRTPYSAIEAQFGLGPSELVRFMRYSLDAKSFARWRRRIHQQGRLKNASRKTPRFKCPTQRLDGSVKLRREP